MSWAVAGDLLDVRDPETGALVGQADLSTAEDAERALTDAVSFLDTASTSTEARSRVLRRAADAVEADAEDYARLIASEGVKTIREARREVDRCAETLRLSGEEAKRISGETIRFDQAGGGAGRIGWWDHAPAGVVFAITPYNDPLNLVAHKVGPAIAVGAPVILKPHPQTPLSALKLRGAFLEAGLDPAAFQVLVGGAELGRALTGDSRVRIVSFTGSRAVGKEITAAAGMKRLLLELGGVSIVAVAADANLVQAAAAISSGAFWAAGQNCLHVQRVIAEQSVKLELADRLVQTATALRCGSKQSEETDMGPLVSPSASARLDSVVARLRADGATLLTGGGSDGSFFSPTWLTGVGADHAFHSEEIFGPVSTIEAAPDFPTIVSRLRRSAPALQAAVFTADIDKAMEIHRFAPVAAVIVNDSTDFRIDAMPFGGVGEAGLGREGVRFLMEDYSERKLFVLRGAAA